MYSLMRGLFTYSEYNHPARMMMTNSSSRIAVVLKVGLMWRKPALEVERSSCQLLFLCG